MQEGCFMFHKKHFSLVITLLLIIASMPTHAEVKCSFTCPNCVPQGPVGSAGEACALGSNPGITSFDSDHGSGGYLYSCGTANVPVNCGSTSSCDWDQTLGRCKDPNVDNPDTKTCHPISLDTGNKTLKEVDYVSDGQSPLAIVRHYRFSNGYGRWTFGYMQKITRAVDTGNSLWDFTAHREDGQKYYFNVAIQSGSGTVTASSYEKYTPFTLSITYASSAPTGYVITTAEGVQETYNSSGKLTEIKTKEGLTKTVTYPSGDLLVTDNVSGLSLRYDTSGTPIQVTSIQVKQGSTLLQTYDYDYDASEPIKHLEKVTYPDATFIEYGYTDIDSTSDEVLALTSKKENGTTYIEWGYDANQRANMSTLGDNDAEQLEIVYTTSAGKVTSTAVTNVFDRVKTYSFKDVGGATLLKQVAGSAGGCGPSDGYFTYDENDANDTYRQKETVTEGVDLSVSPANEGVVTRYKYEDSHWAHLVTTKITGLKWSSSAVKPWGTSGTFDPDATDIQPESQKVVTEWHDDMALAVSKEYYAPDSLVSPTDFNEHEYYRVAYTYDDGTNNCDNDSNYDSYRICSITAYDVNESSGATNASRAWAYTYTYHSGTKVVSSTAINGPLSGTVDTTTYSYNSSGLLTSVVLPTVNGIAQTTSYAGHSNNAFRLPETITDPNGIVSALTYDSRGRINTVTTNSSAVTDFDYYANGLLQKITQPDGSSLEYFYNSAHHLVAVKNNHDDYIEYTPSLLDGQWTIQKVCHDSDDDDDCDDETALTGKFERVFDALGRLSVTKDASSNPKQVFGYDTNNNLTTRTLRGDAGNTPTHDNNDLATVHEYDALDRLIRSVGSFDCGGACSLNTYNNYSGTVPASPETEYEYNGQGLISKVTNANGHHTDFTYNGFGELIEEDSPDRGVTTYAYDAAGNLITKTDARNKASCYAYDNLNRLTGIDYDCEGTYVTANIAYTYDQNDSAHGKGKGRLTAISDGGGSTHYKYDALGRVIKKTQVPTGTSLSLETEYVYNDAGTLTQITYPDEQVTLYGESAGRFTGVDVAYGSGTPTNDIHTITYDPFGGIKGLERDMENSDTLSLARVHDINGRLSSFTHAVTGGTPMGMAYGYDAFNNISGIDRSDDGATDQNFVYDPLQRLVTATGLYGRYTYTYDNVGNRVTQQLQRAPANNPTAYSEVFTETYLYDGQAVTTDSKTNNRLENVTRKQGSTTLRTRTFAHDAAGNTIEDEKVKGATTTTIDLIYGDDNRLHSVEVE